MTEQTEGSTGGGKWKQGRAFSLGTEKRVQISTYILLQHLSCAVLFCSVFSVNYSRKMWLLLLPSCLIALRNNGKQASLGAFEHGEESKQEEVEKSNRPMASLLTVSQVAYPFVCQSIDGC